MTPSAKKRLFTLFMLLLPFALLLTAELALRLLGLFAQEPFIIEATKNRRHVYQLNMWVARRYFNPDKIYVPGVSPDVFAKHKSSKTFRIFCLGGSTTAGFPFDCQVPFPRQLQYLLSQRYPEYDFEVINAGISAVNSFTVIDLLPEILDHDPDLILIYMGHNEFYGAFGGASTISLGQNGRLIRLYLKMQKWHLTQLLKNVIGLFNTGPPAMPDNRTSLMKLVARDQAIPYHSRVYRRTLENFRDNLTLILEMCAGKNVPVLIGDLVANIRDLPPFDSEKPVFDEAVPAQQYSQYLREGEEHLVDGQFRAAAEMLRRAFALDSSAADLWYRLGQAYAGAGDSIRAARFLYGAKDRDVIRFRASEDFNAVIAGLADAGAATLVPVKETFAARAPQRLIGRTLMCDHLHPNPDGYYLMARTFFDAIERMHLLDRPDTTFVPADAPYFVTDLDWEIGLLKIHKMIHTWPFPEKPASFENYQPYGSDTTAQIAREYLFVENVWSKAHYKMADQFIRARQFERARQEYLAVSLYAPDDPYPYHQIARTYELEGDWAHREVYLRRALKYAPNKGMMHYQIAISQWQQKKIADACASMADALRYPDLTPEQKKNARFYLAGFYADLGKLATSRDILLEILREDPGYQPARIFLQKLTNRRK